MYVSWTICCSRFTLFIFQEWPSLLILIVLDSPTRLKWVSVGYTGSTIGFMRTTLTSSLNAAQRSQSDQKWHLPCSPSMISMVVDMLPCAEEKKIEWLAQGTGSWHESMSGNENGSWRNESNHADLKLSTCMKIKPMKIPRLMNTTILQCSAKPAFLECNGHDAWLQTLDSLAARSIEWKVKTVPSCSFWI